MLLKVNMVSIVTYKEQILFGVITYFFNRQAAIFVYIYLILAVTDL